MNYKYLVFYFHETCVVTPPNENDETTAYIRHEQFKGLYDLPIPLEDWLYSGGELLDIATKTGNQRLIDFIDDEFYHCQRYTFHPFDFKKVEGV